MYNLVNFNEAFDWLPWSVETFATSVACSVSVDCRGTLIFEPCSSRVFPSQFILFLRQEPSSNLTLMTQNRASHQSN